jgi:hypothetical protein
MLLSPRLFCPAESAEGEKNSRAAKLSQAEITVKRLGKGIVVDVSPLEGGPPVKVLHDPAQYDTVKAAGFQSVRIYVVAMRGPAVYKTRIDDALDRGLAVVISFFGEAAGGYRSQRKGYRSLSRLGTDLRSTIKTIPKALFLTSGTNQRGCS